MRNKAKSMACCLAALLLCALSGCQLAQQGNGADQSEDRLVGMFLTTEYLDLFDMEGYLNDTLKGPLRGEIALDSTDARYQRRLYATWKERTLTSEQTGETTQSGEFTFEGVGGISYFVARAPETTQSEAYSTTVTNDAVSDGHTSLNIGDAENSTTLEGTVYVCTGGGGPRTFYFNPVYQNADGQVYTTTGSGLSTSGEASAGVSLTQTMTASYTATENGKTKKDSMAIKLTIETMDLPTGIAIVQMDADNAVLARMHGAPGTLPREFSPDPGTQYIVVETTQSDAAGKEKVTRRLYGRDDNTLETFWCTADGICVKQMTQILWPQGDTQPVP